MLERGAEERTVQLPEGRWYEFWNDELAWGRVEVSAQLGNTPLFVRAGTILPLLHGEELQLHVYPPANGLGGGELYSDAGDGYGESRLDDFSLQRSGNELRLSWRSQGEYAFPYSAVTLHWHGVRPRRLEVDGRKVTANDETEPLGEFRQIIAVL